MNTPVGTPDTIPPLRLVAWEITRSCMLTCRHCRASAEKGPYPGELSAEECRRIIDSLANMGSCIVILTGGEPMMRSDIYEIAAYGTSKGLKMVMAPCGLLLDNSACIRLREAGIVRISLSIDGATAASHDTFRGVDGAFDAVMKGIDAARATGLPFQINTTITRTNLSELPDIFQLAIRLGAVSFHPFLLVPTGRGKSLTDEILSAAEYEKTLHWIFHQQKTAPIMIKPTCAPHYYRIVQQSSPSVSLDDIKHPPEHSGLNTTTKGCLGGQGFAFISHIGKVQICGFLPVEAGDLRENGFDFNTIWKYSKLFNEVRNTTGYNGKCGRCDYQTVCGGCRARAYSVYNDYLGEEPFCLYQPKQRNSTDA